MKPSDTPVPVMSTEELEKECSEMLQVVSNGLQRLVGDYGCQRWSKGYQDGRRADAVHLESIEKEELLAKQRDRLHGENDHVTGIRYAHYAAAISAVSEQIMWGKR